jgi:ABC-type transport system involved in Fe-S cluster assembly fused permease/ATPase subunit
MTETNIIIDRIMAVQKAAPPQPTTQPNPAQTRQKPSGHTARQDAAGQQSVIATLAHLWPYIWPKDRKDLQRRVFIAALFLVYAKLITAATPFFFKYATDALAGKDTGLPLFALPPLMLIAAFIFGRILVSGFNQLRDAMFARVGQHAVRKLALESFTHMHRLSLRFHLERRTGGLSRLIERGTKGIESIVRYTVLNTMPVILEFALYLGIFAYYFGWAYVVVIAVTVCAYSVFTIKTSDWRTKIRRDMNRSDTTANAKAIDALLNFETVKYFGNEAAEARRFDVSMAAYETAATKTWTSLGWLNFGQALIFALGMLACMLLSATAVQNGTQTIGDFVLVHVFLMQLAQPLGFIGAVYREIRQALTDIEAMFHLLAIPAEVTDKPNAPQLAVTGGHIRFENVHFHYQPDRTILRGVSFDVPAGRTVAIVGPSGAGKSTISRLLLRFYDVHSGAISIDGQDIRNVAQDSLRAAIGVVPQDTVLFNDTIGYNISYGDLTADQMTVQNAAAYAQIDGFIASLPDGYDTEVGERGLKLSGGEKQRVAIARTILKAPPILILDEATSALDTRTEQGIKVALDKIVKDRTTVVIAHRLSTVTDAHEIIVLDAGEVKERGTHNDLLAQNGLYASMWARQQALSDAELRLQALHNEPDAVL